MADITKLKIKIEERPLADAFSVSKTQQYILIMRLRQGKDESNKTCLVGNPSGYWFFDVFFKNTKTILKQINGGFLPAF